MLDLLIQNASIVDCDHVFCGSVGVKDGKTAIVADAGYTCDAAEILDADGRLLFPGAIDCHAHLNDPGFTWREDFPHGSRAAAVGGVTTIIDMPLQNEPALTSAANFRGKEQAISGRSAVDYCFWGGLVDDNLSEIENLANAGVVALKAFIGPVSPDYTSIDLGHARRAMKIAAEKNILLGFHCEDYAIITREEALSKAKGRDSRQDFLHTRPPVAELIATANILALAEENGAKVHICHISHPEVAELVRRSRRKGVPVTAETCPHYLAFTEQDMLDKGMVFKCAPPLRTKDDAHKLWEYVADGTLSCIGSDHSPCTKSEKSEEINGVFGAWGGISGIQTMVQVFYDMAVNKRGMSPCLLARRLSYDPAAIFGIYGKKGAIAPGFDADFYILAPDISWEITSESLLYKNRISAFVGMKGKGLPVATILRGELIAQGGRILKDGGGALIRRL